jgi:hypothetical protein
MDLQEHRKALFMCAANCQGGHSHAGEIASRVLGVGFPINMKELAAKAKVEGLDPTELWPWWERQRKLAGIPSLNSL